MSGPGEPAERGAIRVADRVVAKIAAQAAREALPALPRTPRPEAAVSVRDRTARVRIALELGYPLDIGTHCGAVRRHVRSRVAGLTGMEVREVAITVERLRSPHLGGAGQERVR
ncbi:Asp23/Gls24 family envelope stress response protein [Streptomyces palmae]|uniref:Asp23/Gls24 family envelope stress response protein n=1 Tax=Streptomyces palmae TaxID=1701085 RepID=A0A4Z0GTR9_9ACTN|nr:Asp23/Gls24 family envelope stress response protein [Streptomyces palmae]TGA99678.1 Asp23/Gls24 family envelope stress response protein [Streptomyces palmae]